TVHDEPGVTSVRAWFPFGEARKLVRDPATGRWTARFLVPRGWPEQGYRIEIAKRFEDGSARRESVWYRLDETSPAAQISLDAPLGLLRIETADTTHTIASVTIEEGNGEDRSLSRVGSSWTADTASLPHRFRVIVRDRAGNRAVFLCSLEADGLIVTPQAAAHPLRPASAPLT